MDEIDLTLASLSIRPGESDFASAFFYNASVAVTPDSVDYKVEDVGSGDLIRDWTPAAPGVSTSVLLDGVDVALLDASDLKEYRRVTFRATKGATTLTASETYVITNIGFQSIVISLGCALTPTLERHSPLPSTRISRVVDLDNLNP